MAFSRRTMLKSAAVTGLAASATTVLNGQSASAAPAAVEGAIAYFKDGHLWLRRPDGTTVDLAHLPAGSGADWAPDGSRLVTTGWNADLYSVRAHSSHTLQISNPMRWGPNAPAFSPDGRFVVYSEQGRLHVIPSDGAETGHIVFSYSASEQADDWNPAVGPDGSLYFDRGPRDGVLERSIYRFVDGDTAALVVRDGTHVAVSPDGAHLAFTRRNGSTGGQQILLADADGGNVRPLITPDDGFFHSFPSWSPDGTRLLFVTGNGSGQVRQATFPGGVISDVPITDASYPVWQPEGTGHLRRIWGATHVETAIATSVYSYADHDATSDPRPKAKVVVLTRADVYHDALGGSALAIAEGGPLLITDNRALDPKVLAEIRRVLPRGSEVVLLGGPLALPTAFDTALAQAGYRTSRVQGDNVYGTAIAIAERITETPEVVLIATAHLYYDALAAGAVAGARKDTVVVLCDGNELPLETLAYLKSLPYPTTFTVGGWAERAVRAAMADGRLFWPVEAPMWHLTGADAEETAVKVAHACFFAPPTAAVATTASWYDALTGGAAIGAAGGPLLLSPPSGLHPATARYLSQISASTGELCVLGGPLALPQGVADAVGDLAGLPGRYTAIETTPTSGFTPGGRRPPVDAPYVRFMFQPRLPYPIRNG